MELRVADNPDKSRYEIKADGEIAGFINYKISPDDIAFIHTEVYERFRGNTETRGGRGLRGLSPGEIERGVVPPGQQSRGMGIAGHLVQASLDSARERGLAVLPYCPYVRSWIGEHLEYAKLVPAGSRAEFGL